MKERVRKCGGVGEMADDEKSKKLNSKHNGEGRRERERASEAGQWMMAVGGYTHAALCQSLAGVFCVAYK